MVKPRNLKNSPYLKNERGPHHGFINLAWICWAVLELPLALPYYLLVILTAKKIKIRGGILDPPPRSLLALTPLERDFPMTDQAIAIFPPRAVERIR
jgi:hypothetical protein